MTRGSDLTQVEFHLAAVGRFSRYDKGDGERPPNVFGPRAVTVRPRRRSPLT
jgi:hypothetical protein